PRVGHKTRPLPRLGSSGRGCGILIKSVKLRSRATSFGIGAIGPYAPDLAILVTRPTRKIDPLSVGSHSRPELSCQRRRIGADLGNRACQRRRIQPLGETDAWQGVSSEKQTIPGWRPLQAVRAIGADIDPAHPRAIRVEHDEVLRIANSNREEHRSDYTGWNDTYTNRVAHSPETRACHGSTDPQATNLPGRAHRDDFRRR